MSALMDGKEERIEELCQKHHVLRLELVGSAASGEFREYASDVDFLVQFAEMPAREHARHYMELIDDLQALFGRHVDLIEEKAIANSAFRESLLSGPRIRVDGRS